LSDVTNDCGLVNSLTEFLLKLADLAATPTDGLIVEIVKRHCSLSNQQQTCLLVISSYVLLMLMWLYMNFLEILIKLWNYKIEIL